MDDTDYSVRRRQLLVICQEEADLGGFFQPGHLDLLYMAFPHTNSSFYMVEKRSENASPSASEKETLLRTTKVLPDKRRQNKVPKVCRTRGYKIEKELYPGERYKIQVGWED